MSIKKTYCFTHLGKAVDAYHISNASRTQVELSNLGLIVKNLEVAIANEQSIDVVLGFDHFVDYVQSSYLQNSYPYLGAVIGRCANRISGAKFHIGKDQYELNANMDHNTLHGGFEGFDKAIWNLESMQDGDEPCLVFSHYSPHLNCGFPGNLTVHATITLTIDNSLLLEFKASTDAPTYVNLTHHGYFNLAANQSLLNHTLNINSNSIYEQDEAFTLNGTLIPVKSTIYDFRATTVVPFNQLLDKTYFIQDHKKWSKHAELHCQNTGLTMEVWSNSRARPLRLR